MRDAARSLAFDPSGAPDIWLRHMRYTLYSPKGLGQPAKVNMYFSMVTGGLICPSRMTALNLRTNPSYSFCGYAQGTFAHQWYPCAGMFLIASRREHVPILSQARVAWDFDEADTSLFWSVGIPSVPHPSVLVPDAQEVAIWEAQDDTWVGRHRQRQMEVAGRAGWGFAVLEPTELSTQAVFPVAPQCLDASDDDAMEEDSLEDQMQESLEIDHAEAAMTDEPTREPKLFIARFGCTTGDHTVLHAEHIYLLRAAQHATRFWKDDGSVLCFVSDCQLVVDSWKRGRQYTGSQTSGDKSFQC